MSIRHAFPEPAEALGATELIEADDPRIIELAARLTGDADLGDSGERAGAYARAQRTGL